MAQAMELTAEEVRVLGSLIEKSQATPAYYPMTLNAITAACNQKSSREPIVDYSEDTVDYAIEKLREKGLAASYSGSGRVMKYGHRIGREGLGFTPAQAAVISLLMLRGPQTPGELKSRAGRQFNFPSVEFVQEILASLMTEEKRYVEELSRRPGQKEVRFRHLFSPYVEPAYDESVAAVSLSIGSEIQDMRTEMEGLHAESHALRERVTKLEAELEKIKSDLYH